MKHDRCNFYISFWVIFLPFCIVNSLKDQNVLKNNRRTPGDIIILHMYTKNYDKMMYGYMAHDRKMVGQADRWKK